MDKFTAIYARQSVDKKDSVSIEAQIDECKIKCKNSKIFEYKDKGFSGKNTERPELQKLLADIEADLIDCVIVYRLDRISRNITDFHNLYELMSKHGCSFISATEDFDTTTTMGRAMMSILAVFAQMERENIQARIKDNYYFRIKDKRWASGKAPFGFKNGKVDGKASLIPVQKEIEAVQFLFNTYGKSPSVSIGQLQSKLIEKGYTGKESNKGFSRTTLHRILSNPIYASADELLHQYYEKLKIDFSNPVDEWDGTCSAALVGKNGKSMRSDDLKGVSIYLTNVKPIIDSTLFLMVQERLNDNKAIAVNTKPSKHLKELSGLLKCSKCGNAVKYSNGYFVCSGRSQMKVCDVSFKGIKLDAVRLSVDEKIQQYLNNFESYKLEKHNQKKKIQNEIEQLQKQLDNLIDLASYSDNVSDAVKAKIDKIQTEIYDLQLKQKLNIDRHDVIETRLNLKSIMQLMDNNSYSYLKDEAKQTVLIALVKKILLSDNGEVNILYKDIL